MKDEVASKENEIVEELIISPHILSSHHVSYSSSYYVAYIRYQNNLQLPSQSFGSSVAEMRRCKVVPGRWKTKVVLLDGGIIVIFIPVTSRLPIVLEFDILG